jgi:hypothetical protein
VAIAILSPVGVLAGQAGSAAIAGRVLDATTRVPLSGVVVQLAGLGRFAETDSAGAFRFGGLDPQLVNVRLFHSGYAAVERGVNLFAGRTASVEYVMAGETASQRLPEVRVAGRAVPTPTAQMLEGFNERRRLGGGVFIDEETLNRWHHRRPADVMRGLPSVRVVGDGSRAFVATNRQATKSFSRGGGPCYLDVLVDGQLLYTQSDQVGNRGGRAPLDINGLIAVSEMAAIEVHSGIATMPAAYRTPGNMCGAIMFWTKRGGYIARADSAGTR